MEYLIVIEDCYECKTPYKASTGNLGTAVARIASEAMGITEEKLKELDIIDIEHLNSDKPTQPGTIGPVFYDIVVENEELDEAFTIMIFEIPDDDICESEEPLVFNETIETIDRGYNEMLDRMQASANIMGGLKVPFTVRCNTCGTCDQVVIAAVFGLGEEKGGSIEQYLDTMIIKYACSNCGAEYGMVSRKESEEAEI